MSDVQRLFIGIDVGTGGVRALAVTETGAVAARASVPLDPGAMRQQAGGHEQAPKAWWDAVCRATAALMARLKTKGAAPESLAALAVDGTSGTLVVLDAGGVAGKGYLVNLSLDAPALVALSTFSRRTHRVQVVGLTLDTPRT